MKKRALMVTFSMLCKIFSHSFKRDIMNSIKKLALISLLIPFTCAPLCADAAKPLTAAEKTTLMGKVLVLGYAGLLLGEWASPRFEKLIKKVLPEAKTEAGGTFTKTTIKAAGAVTAVTGAYLLGRYAIDPASDVLWKKK